MKDYFTSDRENRLQVSVRRKVLTQSGRAGRSLRQIFRYVRDDLARKGDWVDVGSADDNANA